MTSMTHKTRLQESELTADRLREILAYAPETGVFTWKVRMSPNSRQKVGDIAGVRTDRYVRIGIGNRLFHAHRLAWLHTYGAWPKFRIDHENRDKSDNRIGNLRDIDGFGNCQNVGANSRNKCGVKGVCLVGRKWRAMIHSRGKNIFLGMHDTLEEAAQAYAVGAAKYHTHNPSARAA